MWRQSGPSLCMSLACTPTEPTLRDCLASPAAATLTSPVARHWRAEQHQRAWASMGLHGMIWESMGADPTVVGYGDRATVVAGQSHLFLAPVLGEISPIWGADAIFCVASIICLRNSIDAHSRGSLLWRRCYPDTAIRSRLIAIQR